MGYLHEWDASHRAMISVTLPDSRITWDSPAARIRISWTTLTISGLSSKRRHTRRDRHRTARLQEDFELNSMHWMSGLSWQSRRPLRDTCLTFSIYVSFKVCPPTSTSGLFISLFATIHGFGRGCAQAALTRKLFVRPSSSILVIHPRHPSWGPSAFSALWISNDLTYHRCNPVLLRLLFMYFFQLYYFRHFLPPTSAIQILRGHILT